MKGLKGRKGNEEGEGKTRHHKRPHEELEQGKVKR